MSDAIELSPILDIVAAPGLLESIMQHRGRQLVLEAGHVQRLGAQCLQILLAARKAWAEDGVSLQYANSSEGFLTSLELLGVSISRLTYTAKRESGE
ncbi:MAG: STAS domain-containing protein [Rhodospirillales bacterium]|nr:STAS domain-containing protein [Rhodospirillales bacterium]